MSATTNKPFDLGKTFFNGRTVDTEVYKQIGYIGQCYWVLTGLCGKTKSRVRVVKNASGVVLRPGLPVQLNADKTEIVGFGAAYSNKCALVDYGLNSSGVPANDLCYVCEEGPWQFKTPDAMAAGTHIDVGQAVVAKTLAASTNATSAGVLGRTTAPTEATHVLALISGTIARAISAATTGETASLKNCFVDVNWAI